MTLSYIPASSRQQQRGRWPDKKHSGTRPNTFPSWQDELPYFWNQTERAKGPLWKHVGVENSQALEEQTSLGLNTSLSCLLILQFTDLWSWLVNERRPWQYRPAVSGPKLPTSFFPCNFLLYQQFQSDFTFPLLLIPGQSR